jgi:4-amino-4-deoxy-L-arabinose transferase-like glycosyltransferase
VRRLRSPAALLALACAILVVGRIGAAADVRHTFFSTGQQIYDEVANNVLHGHGFSNGGRPDVENPPLYPLAVAAAYGIGGRGWWSVAVMQALFDVGSLLLLYLVARRLVGPLAALVAVFMFALYPYLAAQAALLMDTSLFVLVLLAFVYALTRAADTGRVGWAVATGALAAGTLLVRPTAIAIVVFTPALLALLGADRRRILRVLAPAVAVGLLALVPWTVRNAVRFHAFVPTSAKFGENFYAGNSPHAAEYIADGKSTDLLRIRPDAPQPPERWSDVQRDNWWLHRGFDWAKAHPGDWAHALKIKLEAFWSWDLNPKTLGQTHVKELLYTATYLPLLLVALAGCLVGLGSGRRREVGFVALILGAFTLIHVLVVGYTRLRAPLDPLLMALASLALVEAVQLARRLRAVPSIDSAGRGDEPVASLTNTAAAVRSRSEGAGGDAVGQS